MESCYSNEGNTEEITDLSNENSTLNQTNELNITNQTNEGNETAVIPDGFRRRMLETTEDNNTRLKYGNELCAQGYVGFKCEACDEY